MNACFHDASREVFEKLSSFQASPLVPLPSSPEAVQTAVNTGKKQPRGASGTSRAIKNRICSGASDSAKRWGGTRNSATRTSSSMSLNQATNIIAAAQFAAAIGLPFNRHMTIHWEQAGVRDSRAAWATGRFLKLAGDWIAKRNSQLEINQPKSKRAARIAWAWVRENGDGKGSHVHILLHLPANKITGKNGPNAHGDNTPGKQRQVLGNMPRRWLRLITGAPYRSGTIKTQRIGGTAGAAMTAPAAYQANLAAVVGYILKGASPAVAQALGFKRLEPGGTIIGKRAATSQNIGRAARNASEESCLMNTPDLRSA